MINKTKNKQLINTVKSAGFKSVSDLSRKIEKSRQFIFKNPKVIQILLEDRIEIKRLKTELDFLQEILNYKNKVNKEDRD